MNDSVHQYLCYDCYRARQGGASTLNYGRVSYGGDSRQGGGLLSNTYRPSSWVFLPRHDPTQLYLGVELETDGFPEPRDVVSSKLQRLEPYRQGKFFNKHDGSLANGIEIVSHPATLDYHRTQIGWEEICSTVKRLGGKSHYTHTAGLHVHFSEAYLAQANGKLDAKTLDVNVLKLLYLTKHFWQQFLRFSRRHPTRLGYCKPYGGKKERFRKMTLSQYQQVKRENDRYSSVNVRNPDTIEIRWFRGTLNVKTLYASLELVDFLANVVRRHSAPYLYRLTWTKLVGLINPVKYPNLEAYLIKKKLKEANGACVSSVPSRED